jgi:ornithine decarboxylase
MTTAALLRFDRSRAVFADAIDVAARLSPEAPVFCFSPSTLMASARRFLAGFPGETAFAVKSNDTAPVLKTLARAGIAVWDVASVQEMAKVRAAGGTGVFHYHNPVKSRAEIRDAATVYGCRRFAVDSVEELTKISEVLAGVDGIEIAVRFVLPRGEATSAHDFSSKFGATETEAVDLLRRIAALGHAPVLTFHPGSQCTSVNAYARHIEAASAISRAAGVTLAALNVGGGFPARYVLSEGGPLDGYFAAIRQSALACFGNDVPHLECEPGRGLVATSMSVLARVKLVKAARGEVYLNEGIYGALMEVYQAPSLRPPHRVIRDGAVFADDMEEMTVFGPTCDPLDRLPGSWELPADIREGDFVEFGTLGAYGHATMTAFNGYGGHETVEVDAVFGL